MEIEGKIIQELPLQEGISKAGNPWKKKEWVLETFGTYPRKVKFHIFGDRVDTIRLEAGKSYVISFDLESREFNGRWYTDVSCYAAREADGSMGGGMAAPQQPQGNNQFAGGSYGQQPGASAPAFTAPSTDESDDLPF